jgi:hypothetical protein
VPASNVGISNNVLLSLLGRDQFGKTQSMGKEVQGTNNKAYIIFIV